MADQSLKSKTIKGLIWSSVDKFAVLVFGVIFGVILARILDPSDYGLIGMLAIFLAISQLLVESGFSRALIQKHTPTNDDYSTVFYFNLLVAIFFYTILFFSAPLISSFYNTPQLTQITRILSLSIFINALSLVQQTKLIIRLDFKTQARVSIIAVITSGVLGVWAALQGYGVWALVVQILSIALIKTTLLFYFNRWIPAWVFNVTSFKQLFRFSSNLLAAGLTATFVNNIYSVLIGKYFNAKDLGFYTTARQYPEYLAGPIGQVLLGVSFPVLVSLKNDWEMMVLSYARLMRVTAFIAIPILTILALLTEPFVSVLLTEKWMPVIPLMQWMCFARMLGPICSLNMNMLNVIGRSDLFLRVELFKLPITVGALIVTIPFGLKAIVIGHFVAMAITFIITAYYPGKLFGFGIWRQLSEMKRVVIATIIMMAGVLSCTHFISTDVMKLVLGGAVGCGLYLTTAFLMKIEELDDFKEMIQNLLASKMS